MLCNIHKYILVLILLISTLCCKKQNKDTVLKNQHKKYTTGHIVDQDSIELPVSAKMDTIISNTTGVPDSMIVEPEIKNLKNGKNATVKVSKITQAGQDSFLQPKYLPLTFTRVLALKPDINKIATVYNFRKHGSLITHYKGEEAVKHEHTQRFTEDQKGNLWVASYRKGIFKFDGHKYYHYSEKQGLSTNNAICILNDDNNHIWFGTTIGLTRFDGKYFYNYHLNDTSEYLQITDIKQDNQGNLLVSSLKGLYILDLKNNTFVHLDDNHGLPMSLLYRLTIDHINRVWISTRGKGLSIMQYDIGSNLFRFHTYETQNSIPFDKCNITYQTDNNDIWIGTDEGIVIVNNKKLDNLSELSISEITAKEGLQGNKVLDFVQDKVTKHIYVSLMNSGVSRIEYYNGNFTSSHFTIGENINKITEALYRDSKNQIWCSSTSTGFSKIEKNYFKYFEGINANYLNSSIRFAQDKWGRMWLGCYGPGLIMLDPKSNAAVPRFYSYDRTHGLSSTFIDGLIGDRNGNLWIGTRDKGLTKLELSEKSLDITVKNYLEKYNFPSGFVPRLALDNNDELWCTLFSSDPRVKTGIVKVSDHDLLKYGPEQGLIGVNNWDIQIDKEGAFWTCAPGVGFNKININSPGQKPEVTHFNNQHHLLSIQIHALITDSRNQVWVSGTDGISIIKKEPNEQKYRVKNITSNDGLLQNQVNAMIEDKSNNYWLGTTGGLNKLIPKNDGTYEFLSFTEEDGFPANCCYFNSMYQSQDSIIWIKTNSQLTYFKPSELKLESNPPQVEVQEIKLFNENIDWTQSSTIQLKNGIELKDTRFDSLENWTNLPVSLSLHNKSNFVSIQYSGISIVSPNHVQYSYLLEGWDNNWTPPSKSNEAIFGKLQPGTYTFKVKAKHSLGGWSNTAEYTFKIRPPWYKSLIAYVLYFSMFILGLLSFIKWRINVSLWKVKLIESIRTKISTDLHDDVGSVLTGIGMQAEYLAEVNEGKFHEEMDTISSQSRIAIDKMRDIVWALDSRKDKFENLFDKMKSFLHLSLEKSSFNYNFKTEGIIEKKFISPDIRQNVYLIFKEAITNIIKHSNGDEVQIEFIKQKEQYFLSIYDNGTNKNKSFKDGQGLDNMKKRSEDIKAILNVNRENGFKISLVFS